MDSRERILRALAHEETDITPFSLGFGVNEPVRVQMAGSLGVRDASAVRRLMEEKSDLCWVAPPYIGPKNRNFTREDGTMIDEWGVERKVVSYGAGAYDEISRYVLADVEDADELDDFLWPSPDWFDYKALPEIIDRAQSKNHQAIILGNANIFESSWYMRGLENMLMDLLVEPEIAAGIMGRVTDFYVEFMGRCLEAAHGKIDLIFTADDVGQQNGLIMSIPLWEKSIKPMHVRVNKVVHDAGAKVIYHTDGAVMDIIPGLIDMGIDVLEALQFDALEMDPVKMKELYGDRLCFHGGVSVQSTLPFGTPEQVEREVKERIDVLGRNGGYILAPSHAVQAGTPIENVLAFFRAAGRPLT